MFDDLINTNKGNTKSKVIPGKGLLDKKKLPDGNINIEDEYSWTVRYLKNGATVLEIITTDDLTIDDTLIKNIVKKLRRLE